MNKFLDKCIKVINKRSQIKPEIAVVLGSGLDDFAKTINIDAEIDYKDLPGFPVSTAPYHKGKLILGRFNDTPVVIMQGRVHLYEGYSPNQIAYPIRLFKRLGVKSLILSNAAGGINKSFAPGDIMLISDHISSFVPSPLIGENDDSFGTRFPDMSCVYSKSIRKALKNFAKDNDIALKEGIYLQVTGPQYETPAEICAYQKLGADAVGMSTAIEAIVAKHCGMKVCGISCITNLAAGMSDKPLSHDEVKLVAMKTGEAFKKLLCEAIIQFTKDIC